MTKAIKTTIARLHPVPALKEQIVALDAAMLVAVTSTEVGAVHKLRTTTRRVQAHLTLLDLLRTGEKPLSVPAHTDEMVAVLRRLRRVRRAAGTVRDLDVQTSMIRLDAPQKSTVHKGTPGDKVRKQAKELRKALDAKREAEARSLVRVLQSEEQELATELRALEMAIKPAKRRILSSAGLIDRVQQHFATGIKSVLRSSKQPADLQRNIERLSEDDLHTVRKLAKLCRLHA